MKKLMVVLVASVMMLFQFCSSKKAQVAVPIFTYEKDVQPIISTKCAPCHIPPKGNKKPFTNYEQTKNDIDEIISRVHLTPGDRGFMPFKKTEKLPDSLINVLVQWKAGGMQEK